MPDADSRSERRLVTIVDSARSAPSAGRKRTLAPIPVSYWTLGAAFCVMGQSSCTAMSEVQTAPTGDYGSGPLGVTGGASSGGAYGGMAHH